METNKTIETMLKHRSIRIVKDEPIGEEKFETLMRVANSTASSTCMQMASIIRVKDKDIKKKIAEVANQAYIADFPELLIFLVDSYRNKRILEEKNEDITNVNDMDRFFQGFTDACLMAQNITNAAESMGLGCVFLGSIHNDDKEIIKILNLPELVFPVVGMGIGIPDQDPMLKPRMDINLKLFTDKYEKFDGEYLNKLESYDKTMTDYYDFRENGKRSDKFTDQVVSKTKAVIKNRKEMFKAILEQGFSGK